MLHKVALFLDKILCKFTDLTMYVAGACISIVMLSVCYEVLMRSVFNSPTEWSIEISGYLVLIAGFLGLAPALADNKHISVDLLTSRLSPRVKTLLSIMVSIFGLYFSYLLFTKGWEMVVTSYKLGRTSISTLHVPLFLPQLAIPTGGFLLTFQFVRKIIMDVLYLLNKKTVSHGQEGS